MKKKLKLSAYGCGRLRGRLMTKWVLGDRVTRQVYLDDGTWHREGDKGSDQEPGGEGY